MSVLQKLEERTGIELPPIIEAWNKIDLVSADQFASLMSIAKRQDEPVVPISAVNGDGVEELVGVVEDALRAASTVLEIVLEPSDGAARAWLFEQSEVLSEAYLETGGQRLEVRMDAQTYGRFLRQFPQFMASDDETVET